MSARGITRDILMLYLGYRLIKLWYFKEEFTLFLGVLTVIIIAFSIWFMLERIGVIK